MYGLKQTNGIEKEFDLIETLGINHICVHIKN